MTEGYSGSDLKNLCTTAAYRPVREEKKQRAEEGQSAEGRSDEKEEATEERVIALRPLNMEDMRQVKESGCC
ncbi:hypothetical protein HAX54_008532 [Datura stramonium]|uniref:AAA ATPase AAA+ lid domain-containing protein n=1 Tax=Datura stramonium TaxID=4076 RepID=A0ABS8TDD0_DATST|nr:hypothetical protein [Datura stramonium]